MSLARQKLYSARRTAEDPQLATLSITPSHTAADELWIVHREAPEINDEPQTPDRSEESDDELSFIELPEDG